jgi:hypothetical protein
MRVCGWVGVLVIYLTEQRPVLKVCVWVGVFAVCVWFGMLLCVFAVGCLLCVFAVCVCSVYLGWGVCCVLFRCLVSICLQVCNEEAENCLSTRTTKQGCT